MLYSVISPAKKLATEVSYNGETTQVAFKKNTATLIELLKDMTPNKIASLMHLSEKLAYLNYTRYQEFEAKSYTEKNASPALLLFQGDVYQGLQAETFNKREMVFCQKSLGILSGLYGILAPLDLIQAYRLEMGTKLDNPEGKTLYAFWSSKVTTEINKRMQLSKAGYLLNLASDEYFSVIDKKLINKPIIKIDFKENKDGKLKTIGIHAKRARGAMVNYIVTHHCKTLDDVREFSELGYQYDSIRSNSETLVFIRSLI